MPKPLVNLSITSPGFFGLNKQNSGSILPMGWATEAKNFVFDDIGRPAARKGSKQLNASAISGTPSVRAIHEYIDGAGNSITILAAGNAIYKVNGTSLTDISGTITTPSADNWIFQNFNGRCVGYQSGHAPIQLLTTGGSFTDTTLSGTQQPTTAATTALSAYGRVWVLDGSDLKYSDLLDQTAFNGVFDLSKYWPAGMDEGVALADWNGSLVVFGKKGIIIYENPWDPASTMQIVDSIAGMGCIARDSVQSVGKDLLFLSNSGIRSLGRLLQEKSLPIRDISKNVRDYLTSAVAAETLANIKSTYNESEGLYIISLPVSGLSMVFDIRSPLQDGSYKATEWTIAPTALASLINGSLYMGDVGYIKQYTGYLDDVASDGSGGSIYSIEYLGPWNDFGEQVSQFLKIPKKLSILMGGVSGRTIAVKWAFDYLDSFYSASVTFPTGTVARYGVAKYTIGIYSGLLSFNTAKASMNQTGQSIKFGIEADVNGDAIAIQRFDMLAKIGRYAA